MLGTQKRGVVGKHNRFSNIKKFPLRELPSCPMVKTTCLDMENGLVDMVGWRRGDRLRK